VLDVPGFSVAWCATGEGARERLREGGIDAFVVDVALPDLPGFLLIDEARELGVRAIILAAAVYRKTSYKRRPNRLYGADDYVEIHHLGDHLPQRLRHHLGLPGEEADGGEAKRLHDMLESYGDERLGAGDGARLAELLVSDMLLYNADAIALGEAEMVRERLSSQVDDLASLYAQVHQQYVGVEVGAVDARRRVTETLGRYLENGAFASVAAAMQAEGATNSPSEAP
jgi:CheY-like chemotaxis protein